MLNFKYIKNNTIRFPIAAACIIHTCTTSVSFSICSPSQLTIPFFILKLYLRCGQNPRLNKFSARYLSSGVVKKTYLTIRANDKLDAEQICECQIFLCIQLVRVLAIIELSLLFIALCYLHCTTPLHLITLYDTAIHLITLYNTATLN